MPKSRNPRILVVDDEKSIRDLIRIHLESDGIKAYTAEGGKQALEICMAPDTAVDILITDILMPHMNGRELATRVSMLKPYIKVLFVSAYSAEILTRYNLCPDGADYIKKPFTKAQLMDRISRVWADGPGWKEVLARTA